MLQALLQQAQVPIDQVPGFAVVDLHTSGDALSGRLSVTISDLTYTGILDVGIVPCGVSGMSCIPCLRLGVELKHTQDQKERYKQRQAASAGDCM